MITEKNRFYVELLLRNDRSYTEKDEINGIEELREFIKGLFELTDEFVTNNAQPSKEEQREHFDDVKKYVINQLGANSKLVEDINIEIRNQNSDMELSSNYYDDLIKLRAAINWND